MYVVDRVFYLIPKRQDGGEQVSLFLPTDLIGQADGEISPSFGFGIFTFLRSTNHRGKPRQLSFPAVVGFGEDAQVVNLTLQSNYVKTRQGNANRFSFVPDEMSTQLGEEVSFSARKFPPQFELAGAAASLSRYSLWSLIPVNRDHLEILWKECAFYLLGYGALD